MSGLFLVCIRRQRLIAAHQFRHAAALRCALDRHSVRLHHRAVVLMMRPAQFAGHGDLVVQIRQRAIRIQRPRVENRLRRLRNPFPLRIKRL